MIIITKGGGYLTEKNKRSVRARRLIKGSIGVSLMETELLIQQAYRRLREAEERHSSRLRDKILLSVFQYTNFESEDFRQEGIVWKERSRVLERKKEIAEALANIGLNDSSLSQEVDNFFNQLTDLFKDLQRTKEGADADSECNTLIGWLMGFHGTWPSARSSLLSDI